MRVFTQWNEVSTSVETTGLLASVALLISARISNNDIREPVQSLIEKGDWLALCEYPVPYDSISVSDARALRQVQAFFSKRDDLLVPGIDPLKTAERNLVETEAACRQTNHIYKLRALGQFSFLPHVEPIFHRAQRKIARILGDVPSLTDCKIRFGPGATTQTPRRMSHPRRKLSATLACSEDSLTMIHIMLGEIETWVEWQHSPNSTTVPVSIESGKLVFVPKSFKTKRPVIINPSLDTMFQLGIGDYMADRLRANGIDISDQGTNQRLAREGSLTGALATLDLKSASNTISRELVFDLLPIDWALFLKSFQATTFVYEDRAYRQEMFSSMGNGFTFPLETLLFYALAWACCEEGESVRAYGDDVIVPSHRVPLVREVLCVAGFQVNEAKSFSTGPFRESCGADYLSGFDIRPFYVKGPLACFNVFSAHNFFVRQGDTELAHIFLSLVSEPLRRFGPDGYGDGHLLGDHELRPHGRDKGYGGYTFQTYTFSPPKEVASLPGDHVYPAYCTYVSDPPGQDVYPLIVDGRLTSQMPKAFRDLVHRYEGRDLVVTLPGRSSYNLIKIYVFA